MGDCKNNMKLTADKNDKNDKNNKNGSKLLGLLPRKRTKDTIEESAKSFADMIKLADQRIGELIVKKEAELATEKGREEYNRIGLSMYKTIQFHIDEIIEQICLYNELSEKK